MLDRPFHGACSLIVSFFLLGSVAPTHASEISGVHEIVFGVSDIDEAITYWERFGYRVVAEGKLSETGAMALYNVPSKAKAVRMQHLDADHGHVRLWEWENETGPGAGIVGLLTPGSRWVSSWLNKQFDVYLEALVHRKNGNPMYIVHVTPLRASTDKLHMGELSGWSEIVILTPDYRRIFAQRWGEGRPNFGKYNFDSHYQSTQITHVGLVIESDDPTVLDFYPDVLGIEPRAPERYFPPDEVGDGTRLVHNLPVGKGYARTNFGNPSDTATDRRFFKSGSLMMRRMLPDPTNPPVEAGPGTHGLSLYTYAVKDIHEYHERVSASRATRVTEVLTNEFGEKSFSFVSPGGADWTLVEWKQ